MNKTKKIATAVVSIVLASSMLVSMTACNSTPTISTVGGLEVSATLNDDGTVNYNYASGTGLNMNVGYSTARTAQISYTTANIGGSVTMPDGVSYSANSLKPAWAGLEKVLDVTFTDSYTNLEATAQITNPINTGTLSRYNVITGQGSEIVTQATSSANTFLDLSQYLDYMPNYKKFLEDNPIVYLSLTSDTSNGAMYYAPYFDGNDDIEKYEIAKKNWISTILDSTTQPTNTLTFADQASAKKNALKGSNVATSDLGIDGTKSSVESFMGTEGSWWIESTDPTDSAKTVKITVNYNAARTAAQSSTSALGKAYYAAVGSVYSGTSGNIVDIQNAAINATDGKITGAQLTSILQAYIDVAYLGSDDSSYYKTRSDVFNGSDAAWDVDLLVALMRCVVTYNITNLNSYSSSSAKYTDNAYVYGITGRQATTQRMNDMVSLAGELYGVRGLASRYNYTYIDSNGDIQEARAQADTYNALDKMHAMVEEGLYNANEYQGNGTNSYYTAESDTCEALMGWDYVQTQTANGGYTKMGLSNVQIETDYDFEPIVTPVSLWNDGDTSTDENSDGISYCYSGSSKYMRFTESWRSVKDTGFCVPYASVANDPDKLAAVLAFIDYFFSNDGQILMSFGTQSTSGTNGNTASSATAASVTSSDNGWWYGNEVTDKDIDEVATKIGGQYYIDDEYAAQYFCYNNKLYTGTYYNGKQYPTMTNSNLAFYYGNSVNGVTQSISGTTYTVYATDSEGNLLDSSDNIVYTYYESYTYNDTTYSNVYVKETLNDDGTIKSVSIYYLNTTNGYVYKDADFTELAGSISGVVSYTDTADAKGIAATGKLSYTNYARYIIGAALPIGNKLQAFEFQCTSDQGINGGNVVAEGLVNGTISHVYQTVGTDNGKGYWYTEVPTTLPYDSATSRWISNNVAALDGTVFVGSSSTYKNFFIDIIYYGLGAQTNTLTYLNGITMPATAADCISVLNSSYSLNTYVSYMQEAWENLDYYYQNTIKASSAD